MARKPTTPKATRKATATKATRKPTTPKATCPAPPRRRPNSDVRGREHLTPEEVEKVADAAAKLGRHGHRDALLIRMAFRHGLRVSEVCNLRRDQVDLATGRLHVRRVKRGLESTHPLGGRETRELRRLFRESPDGAYVFTTERGGPLTESGVYKVVARAGRAAGLAFPVHPHMLRHATGFKLANEGRDTRAIQQYLGHRNIQHTVRYTTLAPGRFKDFWDD
jgi:type 1 fimbriae regulatory protein FimB/type 1 fimbriae regulatory protein FimE